MWDLDANFIQLLDHEDHTLLSVIRKNVFKVI